MFDFDTATMARVLKVPSEKFRDKVFQTLEEYMTTMRRELGAPPSRDAVVAAYTEACAAVLGRPVVRGELRPDELELAERLDERFASRTWLEEGGGLRRPFVKIHEGVRVTEGAHKAAGGLIRAIAVVRDGALDDIVFSGDFTARPPSLPNDVAAALVGCPLDEATLTARVTACYERVRPEIPGVGPADWTAAVRQATMTEAPA
jgi:lipoate-protein ligase A